MKTTTIQRVLLLTCIAAFGLSACSGGKVEIPRKSRAGEIGVQYEDNPRDTLFGEGGLSLGGGTKKSGSLGSGGGGIGVNSYLWRASLDTIAFMPVTSADPFGGVIITDWFSPSETPNERFKLNVYVLGRALRADGIRVSVFRQVYDANANWRDAAVEPDAGRKLEDAVLTRARQLRNETRMLKN
ncbi:MAG: DUF3576 domain-containing protein [Magnetovibrio sp.]|nr:DUF3576 domain-containing protein [Magnetovibrio sp.]